MKIHPPYPRYNFFRRDCALDSVQCAIDASVLAYSDLDCYIKKAERVSFSKGLIKTPLFQCLTLEQDGCLLVAFRGTLDNKKIGLADWLVDLEVEKNALGFHHGFYEAVCELAPQLAKECIGKDVIFTGHSLGAAMAAIAAFKLRGTARSVRIVNFGQPKIGDQKAVDLLKGTPWTRYVHGEDIVTKAPLKCMDYVHGGEEIKLLQVSRHWWQMFSREKPFVIPLCLWDHVPTLYAKRIWEG